MTGFTGCSHPKLVKDWRSILLPIQAACEVCGLESNIPQRERGDGRHEHQTSGHEFLCLGEANGEHDEQRGHENVFQTRAEFHIKEVWDGAQHQGGGETARHVERHLAVRFQKSDESADDQQDDVNPEHSVLHGAQPASSALHVQAQNFTRLTVGENFHRAAADFAVGGEAMGSRAGVHGDFKALAAVGTLNFFRNFHGNKLGRVAGVGKCGVG